MMCKRRSMRSSSGAAATALSITLLSAAAGAVQAFQPDPAYHSSIHFSRRNARPVPVSLAQAKNQFSRKNMLTTKSERTFASISRLKAVDVTTAIPDEFDVDNNESNDILASASPPLVDLEIDMALSSAVTNDITILGVGGCNQTDNSIVAPLLESTEPSDVLLFSDETQQDAGSSSQSQSTTATTTFPPVPTLRECLSFMLPALGIYAAPPLMSLIDAAFIGRTSSIELAALGPASSISDSASLPLLFLSIAATNLIAKSMSKGDIENCRMVTRACLGLGMVGGVVIAAAVFAKRHLLSALYCGELSVIAASGGGLGAATLTPLCSSYVAIRALALPAVVLASISQAVCIGIKDTGTPMAAVLLAAILNFAGDLILVPGLGLGIAGAAWATSASQICAAGLLLRVLAKRGLLRGKTDSQESLAPVKSNVAAVDPDLTPKVTCESSTREIIAAILGFIPFLFVMGVKIGMHNTAAATAASIGGAPAAAHTALFAVGMLCFTFGDTGSSLSQAFLPAFASNDCVLNPDDPTSAKGRRKKPISFDIAAARPTIMRLLKCTFGVSAAVVAISSTILTVFAESITNDPAVIHQMRRALPFMAGTLSLHGTAVTLEGLLLAQQNFRGLTATYAVVAMTIAAMIGYVRTSGLGLLGVWATYVWFQLSRVVAFSVCGGLWPRLKLKRKPWSERKQHEPKTAMATDGDFS